MFDGLSFNYIDGDRVIRFDDKQHSDNNNTLTEINEIFKVSCNETIFAFALIKIIQSSDSVKRTRRRDRKRNKTNSMLANKSRRLMSENKLKETVICIHELIIFSRNTPDENQIISRICWKSVFRMNNDQKTNIKTTHVLNNF